MLILDEDLNDAKPKLTMIQANYGRAKNQMVNDRRKAHPDNENEDFNQPTKFELKPIFPPIKKTTKKFILKSPRFNPEQEPLNGNSSLGNTAAQSKFRELHKDSDGINEKRQNSPPQSPSLSPSVPIDRADSDNNEQLVKAIEDPVEKPSLVVAKLDPIEEPQGQTTIVQPLAMMRQPSTTHPSDPPITVPKSARRSPNAKSIVIGDGTKVAIDADKLFGEWVNFSNFRTSSTGICLVTRTDHS